MKSPFSFLFTILPEPKFPQENLYRQLTLSPALPCFPFFRSLVSYIRTFLLQHPARNVPTQVQELPILLCNLHLLRRRPRTENRPLGVCSPRPGRRPACSHCAAKSACRRGSGRSPCTRPSSSLRGKTATDRSWRCCAAFTEEDTCSAFCLISEIGPPPQPVETPSTKQISFLLRRRRFHQLRVWDLSPCPWVRVTFHAAIGTGTASPAGKWPQGAAARAF